MPVEGANSDCSDCPKAETEYLLACRGIGPQSRFSHPGCQQAAEVRSPEPSRTGQSGARYCPDCGACREEDRNEGCDLAGHRSSSSKTTTCRNNPNRLSFNWSV